MHGASRGRRVALGRQFSRAAFGVTAGGHPGQGSTQNSWRFLTWQEIGPGPVIVHVGEEREAHEAHDVEAVKDLRQARGRRREAGERGSSRPGASRHLAAPAGCDARPRHARVRAGRAPRSSRARSTTPAALRGPAPFPAHLEEAAAHPVDGGRPEDQGKGVADAAGQEIDGAEGVPVRKVVPKPAGRRGRALLGSLPRQRKALHLLARGQPPRRACGQGVRGAVSVPGTRTAASGPSTDSTASRAGSGRSS